MRILTVGHSYVVELNRAIMERVARHPDVDLTVAAPRFFQGDLRPISLEVPDATPPYRLVPLPVSHSNLVHIFFYRHIRNLMKSGPFDLMHIWEEPYILAGYQLARSARRAGIPYFFWTAQNLSKRYPPPFGHFERYCVAHARGWLACGHLVRQTLLDRGYPGADSEVIGLAVDEERFRPDPEAGARLRSRLGLEGPVVGYLGRLTAEKGIEVLMAAMDRVPGPWSLLVVGGGPYEPRLRRWAAERGWSDRLRLMIAKHDEVPDYIRAMDVLLAPSRTIPTWREQFGRMIIEAFACRIAVIGSDSGEIPYVVGDAGVIVPEADVAAWAGAIEALLRDPDRRLLLAEAGYRRCLAHFTSAHLADRYVDYYRRLLGQTADQPAARV